MHILHVLRRVATGSLHFKSCFHSRLRSHPSAGGRNGCRIAVEHWIARLKGNLKVLQQRRSFTVACKYMTLAQILSEQVALAFEQQGQYNNMTLTSRVHHS